jgi:acetylcholinesterase
MPQDLDAAVMQKAVDAMVSNATAYSTRPWGFVIDGKIIPDAPSKMLARGQFARKPFINGDTLDEGTSYPTRTVSTVDEMWTYFKSDYLNKDSTWLSNNETKTQLLQLYPDDPALGSPFNTGAELFGAGHEFKRASAIYGDIRYQAPRRDWFYTALKHHVPGWAYQLNKPYPGAPPILGVQHSADLLYIFLMLPSSITDYYQLAVKMVNYWIAFAHNLDPNYEGGTEWPAYGPESNLMNFTYGELSVVPDTFRKDATDYLISVKDQFGNPKPGLIDTPI